MIENAPYLSGAKLLGDICTLDARHVANHPLAAAQWASEWEPLLISEPSRKSTFIRYLLTVDYPPLAG